jgi:hypothetical protein
VLIFRPVPPASTGDLQSRPPSRASSVRDDIDTAPREHIANAFRVRRGQIVGDCQQLKNDADHRNDEHPEEPPFIPLFDFTDDVTEAGLPSDRYEPGGESKN